MAAPLNSELRAKHGVRCLSLLLPEKSISEKIDFPWAAKSQFCSLFFDFLHCEIVIS